MAGLAMANLRSRRQECIGKTADLLLRLAKQMQGQSLGSAWANTRQPLELIDQPCQWAGKAAQNSLASV